MCNFVGALCRCKLLDYIYARRSYLHMHSIAFCINAHIKSLWERKRANFHIIVGGWINQSINIYTNCTIFWMNKHISKIVGKTNNLIQFVIRRQTQHIFSINNNDRKQSILSKMSDFIRSNLIEWLHCFNWVSTWWNQCRLSPVYSLVLSQQTNQRFAAQVCHAIISFKIKFKVLSDINNTVEMPLFAIRGQCINISAKQI